MKTIRTLILAATLLTGSMIHAQAADPGTRCIATTKKGTRCGNMAMKDSQYCHVHDPATPRCGAITKSGNPCRNPVKHLGDHCRFHS